DQARAASDRTGAFAVRIIDAQSFRPGPNCRRALASRGGSPPQVLDRFLPGSRSAPLGSMFRAAAMGEGLQVVKQGAATEPKARTRILFVDDEPQILDALEGLLRRQRRRWDMVFAVGGEMAVKALASAPFDIVVTDMRMPGIDGAKLLHHVQ